MRQKVIAGNWKMNLTSYEAAELIGNLKDEIVNPACQVVICVPSIYIMSAVSLLKDTPVKVGAQNMFYKDSGAYTGEISPQMLQSVGVSHVIVGHSERREYFGVTDEMVNLKIKKALEHSIIPIVCCGETQKTRDEGKTFDFIKRQLVAGLKGFSAEEVSGMIIAYEPIWAIGTGNVATSAQAQEVCAYIRKLFSDIYSEDVAEKVTILYGGSMNIKNAKELLAQPDIDGGLIGGASLRSEFADIVKLV
ncbi:MAG: triose-phosphate isomerase [Lachnospiraceae bacterium]|nr:triose-phosphate isomerase [Lachnospiraceae bacterium]